ncbi:protein CHLOROPLAST IMPORT APPARATUS 2 [Andrographis paniculata]|uniref:protein CHLOROPLAST IMPORT APPARATUS 2 n=1 Tax=Andrographis paniculata TaxID=175694 RepID=UPI0021E99872|nr:protein CHLOROPLAST IMPORT APPARATUS 2 [Andrographis paniculata]
MSSSCLSGAGRAYRLESLDLEIIKSPSTSSWISNSSSPSSTLSESSNSFSTRKPRTPRKRPNQTYNEAAAILSTAYPKLFPAKHLTKFTKNPFSFSLDSADLLIDGAGFFLQPQRHNFPAVKDCRSPGEIDSRGAVTVNSCEIVGDENHQDDFDAESILDEEIGEGIDSILGNGPPEYSDSLAGGDQNNCCYGYPVGLGFDFAYGIRREPKAFRNVDDGDWWRFPCVNVVDITPPTPADKSPADKTKKKKKVSSVNRIITSSAPLKVENSSISPIQTTKNANKAASDDSAAAAAPQPTAGLLLKLNYDGVLNAWSDKPSPFSSVDADADPAGGDVQARLAQIDLFSDNGGIREASVLRYKEKRRTRLFSKKIRYQVRKVNADRRPRMKGRFVRTQIPRTNK